jgi:hypothetical protein
MAIAHGLPQALAAACMQSRLLRRSLAAGARQHVTRAHTPCTCSGLRPTDVAGTGDITQQHAACMHGVTSSTDVMNPPHPPHPTPRHLNTCTCFPRTRMGLSRTTRPMHHMPAGPAAARNQTAYDMNSTNSTTCISLSKPAPQSSMVKHTHCRPSLIRSCSGREIGAGAWAWPPACQWATAFVQNCTGCSTWHCA